MPATDPDCLFCKIVAGDVPATRIGEDEHTVAFMDINPATRGHALVVPRAHARDLRDAQPADVAHAHRMAQRVAEAAFETLGAAGVNVMQSNGPAAWQTVFHLHVHVVPRYDDDPLELPWVPSPGDEDEIRDAAGALQRGLA